MIINKKNYEQKLEEKTIENEIISEEFLTMLEKLGIEKLNIASVGNSISAGYSKCDKIMPFLMRSALYNQSDNINYYSYARVRRNEEINVLRWYNRNISHPEINALNIDDLVVKKHAYVQKYWNGSTIKNYEELANAKKDGLRDFNLMDNSIIIYNGLTGAVTNAIRRGTVKDKLKFWKNFRKDIIDCKLLFSQIYLDNPHTQVYICGLPNIAGTRLINCFDNIIKELTNEIPNLVYSPGTIRNSLFYLDEQKEFDVHYSRPEYLEALNNVTEKMLENYVTKKLTNSLIEQMREYSLAVEEESTIAVGNEEEIKKIVDLEIEKHSDQFAVVDQDINNSIDDVMRYYQNNHLSTFSCTPKEKVLKKLYNTKKMS